MVSQKRRSERFICLILTLAFSAFAAEPPDDLLRRMLDRETATQAERDHYSYRQTVLVEELSNNGAKRGEYREKREVIFTPGGERHESAIGKPFHGLDRLRMTEEDFADIRNIQPFLFTRDQMFLYEVKFRGEESVGEHACWVMEVKPRQLLQGQRLFEGMVWVLQSDYSVLRMEGRAVPQVFRRKEENLFPRFVTVRKLVDGKYWFPHRTAGDEVLPFRNGPLRMRLQIDYADYKRFGAESSIRFDTAK